MSFYERISITECFCFECVFPHWFGEFILSTILTIVETVYTKFEFQLKVYICGRRKIKTYQKHENEKRKENVSTLNGNE